jgi:septal ring-binding cell division protein DamX
MTKNRASIYDTDDLDLSSFTPKAAPAREAIPAEQVRAIAEASNFPSREAKRRPAAGEGTPAAPAAAKRLPRRHRTGRTAQFNARTTQKTVQAFYDIADQQGWLVAETLEHALAALQRELAGKGRG